MVSELDVSPIFPSHDSVDRDPLPSAGSLGSLLQLLRYYEVIRLLVALLASLVLLGSAIPLLRRLFAPYARATRRSLGLGLTVALPFRGGGDELSQVPGQSLACMPRSQTPAGRSSPHLTGLLRVAFRCANVVGAHNE